MKRGLKDYGTLIYLAFDLGGKLDEKRIERVVDSSNESVVVSFLIDSMKRGLKVLSPSEGGRL